VLPSDALSLATRLCPSASDVRVRFDGGTSHDVLAPLAKLRRLRALSAVCVTSGQRARLDFTDVCGLLESKGRELRQLEIKVGASGFPADFPTSVEGRLKILDLLEM